MQRLATFLFNQKPSRARPNRHSFRQFTDNCRTRYLRPESVSQDLLCDLLPESNSIESSSRPFWKIYFSHHTHPQLSRDNQRHAAGKDRRLAAPRQCFHWSNTPTHAFTVGNQGFACCFIHCAVHPPDSPHPLLTSLAWRVGTESISQDSGLPISVTRAHRLSFSRAWLGTPTIPRGRPQPDRSGIGKTLGSNKAPNKQPKLRGGASCAPEGCNGEGQGQ